MLLDLPALILLVGLVGWAALSWRKRGTDPYAPLPIIGHLHHFLGQPKYKYMQWYLRRAEHEGEGRTFEVFLPGLGSVIVEREKADERRCLKHVLTIKGKEFTKTGVFAKLRKDFYGTGILLAVGDSWRAQRHAGQVFASQSTIENVANILLPQDLQRMFVAFDQAAAEDKVLDFWALAAELTLAVFGKVALDVDSDRFLAMVARPFDHALQGISRRFTNPLWKLAETITPEGRSVRHDIKAVRAICRAFVQETVAELGNEQVGEKSVHEGRALFIRALMDSTKPMTMDELADSCTVFIIAGRETTADAMTWTLYALLQHPTCLDKVVKEFRQLPDMPNAEVLSHLPYFNAVINEALRLYPPVPTEMVENTSPHPNVLPDGTLVRPGDLVLFSPWVMARLKDRWGPDASVFRPERWLEMKHKPSAYELPTFYAGPRSCVGQTLAKVEMAVMFKELFARYDVERGWDGTERVMGEGLTCPMKGGLPIKVSRR